MTLDERQAIIDKRAAEVSRRVSCGAQVFLAASDGIQGALTDFEAKQLVRNVLYDFTPEHVAHARTILARTLPELRSRDQIIDNLYYRDPNTNEAIRIWSIAAAVAVLLGPPR